MASGAGGPANIHFKIKAKAAKSPVIHDHTEWAARFRDASSRGDGQTLRALRIDIMNQTSRICRQKYYIANNSIIKIKPERLKNKSTQYYIRDIKARVRRRNPGNFRTTYEVVDGDCLNAALDLQDRGCTPAVLNMANDQAPGGGYRTGAGAQEENLFRRSNYSVTLKGKYPLDTSGIYSPRVIVFRGPEDLGYELLETPALLDFIAVPAINRPPTTTSSGELRLQNAARETTRDRISLIFDIAAENGHDSIVLSAFGCGAFRNPPKEIAELFGSVLLNEFPGIFRHVVFAIFEDHNSHNSHNPVGNVQPFVDEFSKSKYR